MAAFSVLHFYKGNLLFLKQRKKRNAYIFLIGNQTLNNDKHPN